MKEESEILTVSAGRKDLVCKIICLWS